MITKPCISGKSLNRRLFAILNLSVFVILILNLTRHRIMFMNFI